MFLSIFFALFCLIPATIGCMCAPSHPQEQMCKPGSFVALMKVKSESYVDVDPVSLRSGRSANHITTISHELDHDYAAEDDQMRVIPTAAIDDDFVGSDMNGEDRYARYIRYRVKIYKAFKGIETLESLKAKYYIYTAASDATCGKKLEQKRTYLIFGSIVNGRLMFGLCDHVIQWNEISKTEKRNIRDNLRDIESVCNLNCEVATCLWSNCIPKHSNLCSWDYDMETKYGAKVDKANFMCTPRKDGRCEWGGAAIAKESKEIRRRRHSKSANTHHQSSKRSKKLIA